MKEKKPTENEFTNLKRKLEDGLKTCSSLITVDINRVVTSLNSWDPTHEVIQEIRKMSQLLKDFSEEKEKEFLGVGKTAQDELNFRMIMKGNIMAVIDMGSKVVTNGALPSVVFDVTGGGWKGERPSTKNPRIWDIFPIAMREINKLTLKIESKKKEEKGKWDLVAESFLLDLESMKKSIVNFQVELCNKWVLKVLPDIEAAEGYLAGLKEVAPEHQAHAVLREVVDETIAEEEEKRQKVIEAAKKEREEAAKRRAEMEAKLKKVWFDAFKNAN
jgi:hypothetical protein